jgi:hypothetical protein
MGCDIHATLEYDKYYLRDTKKPKAHYWDGFAKSIDIDRGYYFFGILAGVRNGEINSIADPRGVPDNASFDFKQEYDDWDMDAHTPSWVSFKELRDWKHTSGKLDFDPEQDMKEQDFYKVMEMLAEKYGDENVRLVFFFDN